MEHVHEGIEPFKDENSKNHATHEESNATHFEITVSYNGINKTLLVSKSELIRDVLAKAIALFGSLPSPHTLALFTADRGELPEGQSVKEAGIKKHEQVLLRPSTVKAG